MLTCIREGVTIDTAGRRLEANAERHLKPPQEMARLFRHAPEAIAETGNLLARIDFSLDDLRYEYPDEPVPPGWKARRLAREDHLGGRGEALSRRHSAKGRSADSATSSR